MCKLNVQLADGETRMLSLGLARAVDVTFAPGVVQTLDFWVVPLAMDVILGMPWLQSTQPAIDWGLSRVLWQHKGSVITVYGRGGLPPPPLPPVCAVVLAKHFLHVMQKTACTRMLHLLVCCNQPQQQTCGRHLWDSQCGPCGH